MSDTQPTTPTVHRASYADGLAACSCGWKFEPRNVGVPLSPDTLARLHSEHVERVGGVVPCSFCNGLGYVGLVHAPTTCIPCEGRGYLPNPVLVVCHCGRVGQWFAGVGVRHLDATTCAERCSYCRTTDTAQPFEHHRSGIAHRGCVDDEEYAALVSRESEHADDDPHYHDDLDFGRGDDYTPEA